MYCKRHCSRHTRRHHKRNISHYTESNRHPLYHRYNNKEIQHNCKCIYWHKTATKCRCIQHPMNPQIHPHHTNDHNKTVCQTKYNRFDFCFWFDMNITHVLPHKKQCLQLDLRVTGTARCYYFLKFALGIINTILPAVKFFNYAISETILTTFWANIDACLSVLNLYQCPSNNTPHVARHAQNIPW